MAALNVVDRNSECHHFVFFLQKSKVFSLSVALKSMFLYTHILRWSNFMPKKRILYKELYSRWQNPTITSTLNYDTRRQHRHKSQITASLVISASCSFHLSNTRDSLQGIVTKANYMSFHTLKLRQQMSID